MRGSVNIRNLPLLTIKLFLILVVIASLIIMSCKTETTDHEEAPGQSGTVIAGDSEETYNNDIDDPGNGKTEELPLRLELFKNLIKDISGRPNMNYTFQSPGGNRLTSLKGDLTSGVFMDIKLKGNPVWVVSGSTGRDSLWTVMLDNGSVQVFKIEAKDNLEKSGGLEERFNVLEITENISSFESPAPPVSVITDNSHQVLDRIFYNINYLTHPVIIGPPYQLISIGPDGKLGSLGESFIEYDINALPDGRIVSDDEGLVYILTDPSTDYDHGILGDEYEATSIMVLDSKEDLETISNFNIGQGDVIESLYPIIYDLDQDGSNEIIVTLSNSSDGARIVVFDLDGDLVAEGPLIGTGRRWRHQLAVAPFGPGGEIELVDVLTPHIGGIVEFYRLQNERLEIITKIKGYSSHQIGSRNLDMALAGDFDNDGQVELLIPDQSFSKLGIIKHGPTGAKIISDLYAGGKIATNIAVTSSISGSLILGIGREDGFLRIWFTE